MLEFRTLGSIQLRADDDRSTGSLLHHPKRLALLAYLCASQPLQAHRRDTLIALLWPELDDAHARGALRQELYQLRRALGPGAVRGYRSDVVEADPAHVRCDVRQFEEALDGGRLAEALALWHGDFLPGLHAGGEFERWVDEERERLSRRASAAARQLLHEAEGREDLAGAVGWARRLVELTPYDETGWRRLILLLDQRGDRAAALRAYDVLATRLRTDLEVEPSPETQALAARIRERASGAGSDGLELEARAPPATGFPARTERAVIGLPRLQNRTGDPSLAALARRATDRITQGLSGALFIDVASSATARGLTAVLSATLYREGDQVEIVPCLREAGRDGRVVEYPRPVRLTPETEDERLDLLTAHVLVSVAAHYDPRFDAAATRERALPIRTPLWEAYLEYLRGSELFGHFQAADAHRHLRAAWEIDPDFVKAGIFAAIALAAAGDPVQADSLAARVMAVPRPLCEYERTMGEWFLADLHGRRTAAYQAALEGVQASSSPVVAYLAAREATRINRPREALRLLDGIRFWERGWWRHRAEIVEITCGAHHLLGSHEAELAAALEGRTRYPAALEAISAEVRARAALGDAEEVLRLVEEALTLPRGESSPALVAWTAAQELDAHGQAAMGAVARRTVIQWLTCIPRASPGERRLLTALLLEAGDVAGAARALHSLAPSEDLDTLGLTGLCAGNQGDEAGARQVIAALEGLEHPYLSGRHLLWAAGIQARLDSGTAAITTLRRAFSAGLPFDVTLHALPMLRPLAARTDFRTLLLPRG